MKELDCCMLCPRMCGVNRNEGETGYCGSDSSYQIGSICIHHGEEPVISGKRGICNVFFTGCNLQCIYCQNYQISQCGSNRKNRTYTLNEVTDTIMYILDQGIEAVGFVTPTHFTPHVKAIITALNQKGYHPITVYNTNAYDSPQVIRTFEALIDVYLPDFKYFDPELAAAYSGAGDYPGVAQQVLKEMYRQKGSTVVVNDEGQAVTGLIIRHLVLPGQEKDSASILKWIADELSPSISISLMSQYYPTACVTGHPVLDRQITATEYNQVLKTMEELGFHKGWIQDFDSSGNYRPDFSKANPFSGDEPETR